MQVCHARPDLPGIVSKPWIFLLGVELQHGDLQLLLKTLHLITTQDRL